MKSPMKRSVIGPHGRHSFRMHNLPMVSLEQHETTVLRQPRRKRPLSASHPDVRLRPLSAGACESQSVSEIRGAYSSLLLPPAGTLRKQSGTGVRSVRSYDGLATGGSRALSPRVPIEKQLYEKQERQLQRELGRTGTVLSAAERQLAASARREQQMEQKISSTVQLVRERERHQASRAAKVASAAAVAATQQAFAAEKQSMAHQLSAQRATLEHQLSRQQQQQRAAIEELQELEDQRRAKASDSPHARTLTLPAHPAPRSLSTRTPHPPLTPSSLIPSHTLPSLSLHPSTSPFHSRSLHPSSLPLPSPSLHPPLDLPLDPPLTLPSPSPHPTLHHFLHHSLKPLFPS